MANHHLPHTEEEQIVGPQEHTPLIDSNQTQQQEQEIEIVQNHQKVELDTHLDKTLQWLDSFLSLLGFNQTSVYKFGISLLVFLLVGVFLPVGVLVISDCSGCEQYQVVAFELDIVASQACLAAVSLLCLSHNLRKYRIRKFMFVDRNSGHVDRFSDEYIRVLSNSVRLLGVWVLPCLILKTAREIIRILYIHHESWWQSIAILLALVISWTYVSTIFLAACVLFHLVCNLQIIHFDDYGKLLERESNILILVEEHSRLRQYLSKISHRFRIYLLLVFLVVTASQVVTLFRTTGYRGTINFFNGGDFAVSSLVQVVGISLCLNAAAKISHRAQGIVSIASKWHTLLTCTSEATTRLRTSNSVGSLESSNRFGSFYISNSETDLESLNYVAPPRTMHLASYLSAYHQRQSFVMYLQNNPGGITIFGWTVDRGLINTIFFIELSLVLFVLGKTIVFD